VLFILAELLSLRKLQKPVPPIDEREVNT